MKKLVLTTVVVGGLAAAAWYMTRTAEDTAVVDSLREGAERAAALPDTTEQVKPAGPVVLSSVAGTVTYTGATTALEPIDMASDPACAALHTGTVYQEDLALGGGNGLRNVFIKVVNPPDVEVKAPADPVVIASEGCVFKPRVAGVMVGQALRFLNKDGILKQVHGLPRENAEWNRGQPFQHMEFEERFDKPEGPFPVKDDLHPWAQAYVAVVSHPFFAVTDENGRFTIANLPDGTYEIEAWHERLGTQQQTVTISGGNAPAAFSFGPPSQ